MFLQFDVKMVNTGEEELNGQMHLSNYFLYSHDFQNYISVQISLLKFRYKYPITHWTFSHGWRALKCISPPLSVSFFSSSSHICYLNATIQFYQFCFQNISWIFPLLLSPLPIEHVYVLTTIITHLNDPSISLSGLPSSKLFIYAVLSPKWTSKMKNLTITFQIDHHSFQ